MKILIFMSGFFPGEKYGGPPVSVDNFCTLMDKYTCYIVTKNHDMEGKIPYNNIEKGWNNRENCKVYYLEDRKYNIIYFNKIISDIQPDMIYLQGLFQECVFPCLIIAKKRRIKVLLAPRGELCAGAFRKKYKKIPYIVVLKVLGLFKNVHFQYTSEEESESIVKYLNGVGTNMHYLSNIPSIPKKKLESIKKRSGSGRFVFLSRIVSKKNLLFAIKCLRQIKGNIQFDIYGPIEDEQYWKECKKEIDNMPSNVKVVYQGILPHDEVHKTLCQYHAFLFPTLSENYGHVIAEAMLSGCAVIISDQTPWTDVNLYKSGWSLSLKESKSFVEAIQIVVNMNDTEFFELKNHISNYILNKLKLNELCEQYKNVIGKMVKGEKFSSKS